MSERLAELHRQRAKLASRNRMDSAGSAVAKRRQKIEREIAALETQRVAEESDRHRRMLLLIAAAS